MKREAIIGVVKAGLVPEAEAEAEANADDFITTK